MRTIWTRCSHFLSSEDGPTATEYAVMLALIVAGCITVIGSIGGTVEGMFADLDDGLQQ